MSSGEQKNLYGSFNFCFWLKSILSVRWLKAQEKNMLWSEIHFVDTTGFAHQSFIFKQISIEKVECQRQQEFSGIYLFIQIHI